MDNNVNQRKHGTTVGEDFTNTAGKVKRRIEVIKRHWTPEERRVRRANAVLCIARLASLLGVREKVKA